MDERDSERGSLHLSAFVAGARVGAGMALLLTPQPGAEVRGMLRRYASKSRENVVEHGRDALQTAVDRGKEYMEKGKEAVRSGGCQSARGARRKRRAQRTVARRCGSFEGDL